MPQAKTIWIQKNSINITVQYRTGTITDFREIVLY